MNEVDNMTSIGTMTTMYVYAYVHYIYMYVHVYMYMYFCIYVCVDMSIYANRIEVTYKTFELRSNILQPMLSTSFHILPTPKIGD